MRRLTVLLAVATGLATVQGPAADAGADPTCHGLAATIVGTSGRDVLKGTRGPDVIAALEGDDVVKGRGGDDVVCGGPGHDYLVASRGHDVLIGGPQGDRIDAFSRRPTIVRGGGGADILFLGLSDEPGYVLDGGRGHDIGDVRLGRATAGGPTTVIRRGPGQFVRDGSVTGAFLSIEVLGLDGQTGYEYYGTRAQDVVSISDGAFPFRARTYGGDDEVVSYEGDDVIDTGGGRDRVDAGPGEDVCLNAERARGCESGS